MRSAATLKKLLCIAVLAAVAAPPSAHAQNYPVKSITVVVPFPAGWAERRGRSDRGRTHGADARPPYGDRECRRRRRHDWQRARRGGGARRLYVAGGQHGFAGCRAGADAKPEIRSLARFRTNRLYRAFAGGDRRAQGFPRQGHHGAHRLPKAECRQGEASTRRHRRVLPHGVPAVQLGTRPQADARRLPRHRARDERSDRRPR